MGGRHFDSLSLFKTLIVPLTLFLITSPAAKGDNNNSATVPGVDMSTAILIRVDQSGNEDFKTIQAAIDSVPSNNNQLVFIRVKPGIYREKVVVPVDKPFITLSGSKSSNTILTWSNGDGILESPTLAVFASDFVGRYITIENTYGEGATAVAARVAGLRAAFYGCEFKSYQDTLLDDNGNHYYKNCYIQGATDFICGNAASIFEKCHLHSISEAKGYITAQKRSSVSEKSGFVFLGCKITGLRPRSAYLGRPWADFSRVVFAFSYMSSAIISQGWTDWGDQDKQRTVYQGEYKCYGPGAERSKRAIWSRNLSDEEAATFLTKDLIGGSDWLRPTPTHFKRALSKLSLQNINAKI